MEIIKSRLFVSVAVLSPMLYAWKRFVTEYTFMLREYKNIELFYARHNCVIRFSKGSIEGWHGEHIETSKNNFDRFLDPYLFFINTAKSHLDIAVMSLSLSSLVDAVCNAVKRGVKVRLLVNFQSVKLKPQLYNSIQKSGVEIAYYVSQTNSLDDIMHFKYMLKDWNEDGYVCMGSMNYTGLTSVVNNFENVVFTSQPLVVLQFRRNFEDSWNRIKIDNQNDYDKLCLIEYGFDVL